MLRQHNGKGYIHRKKMQSTLENPNKKCTDSIWRKQSNIAETYINVVSDTSYRIFNFPRSCKGCHKRRSFIRFRSLTLKDKTGPDAYSTQQSVTTMSAVLTNKPRVSRATTQRWVSHSHSPSCEWDGMLPADPILGLWVSPYPHLHPQRTEQCHVKQWPLVRKTNSSIKK